MNSNILASSDVSVFPLTREEWSRLLEANPEASPFQSPEWMEGVCLSGRFKNASLAFRTGDCNVALLLAARHIVPGLTFAAALPHGMGAGGILADCKLTEELLKPVFAFLAGRSYSSILVRPNPLQCGSLTYGTYEGWQSKFLTSHVLDLSGGFDEVWKNKFSSKRRGHIRKARRSNLTVVEGNNPQLVQDFYALYLKWCEGKAKKGNMPPAVARITGRWREPFWKFASVAKTMGDKLTIFLACLDDIPVAGAVLVMGGTTAAYWRSASDLSASAAVDANDFLQDIMIRRACDTGCRYYHMGESGGVKSLEAFKESLGARPVAYVEFVHEKLLAKAANYARNRMLRTAERILRRNG